MILIIGASGLFGHETAKQLLATEEPVRPPAEFMELLDQTYLLMVG